MFDYRKLAEPTKCLVTAGRFPVSNYNVIKGLLRHVGPLILESVS
jgi:hypothetical protein